MSRSDEFRTHLCEGGCGHLVSGNKHLCMACIQGIASARVTAREEDALPYSYEKHIISYYDSKDQEDLYRADGMLVASRQGDVVRFGHDISTAQSRLFLTTEHARKWLRKLAEVDQAASERGCPLHELIHEYQLITREVVIEERNAESVLTLPGRLKGAGVH